MDVPATADAVVIGSGFAGCSAAVRLAEAGKRVVLIEEAPRLGGRASSFIDRDTGERVDNGQHALFGCYTATYDFLNRVGAAYLAPLQPALTVSMARHGRLSTLSCPPLPAPLHLIAGLMRWNAISMTDRASAIRMRGVLRRISKYGAAQAAADVQPEITVADWLKMQGQSQALCDWLWRPLAVAALNQSPDIAAAAPFVRVLGELFAPDPAAAAIGLPSVPLDDLYAEPARQFLESCRGQVLVKRRATVVLGENAAVAGVRVGDQAVSAPVVVSAVSWRSFARLWSDRLPTALNAIATNSAAMADSPIVTVNLWCAPESVSPLPSPFVGFVDGPMHWVFDKSRIFSEPAGHLSIVSSGADAILRLANDELTTLAADQLRREIPQMRDLRVDRSVVVREPRATFSLAPKGPPRPGTRTPVKGFFLAGDWTDTGLPGTIEGAVRSGYAAAAAAIAPTGT
jgi:squalene-associated FAD-dependent desaturase